ESGPCLSPRVAGRPLRPATRRRLGRPLPHPQTDRPRAHPQSKKTFHHQPCGRGSYPVLDPVSRAYPEIRGRVLTCYSPVRHSATPSKLRASAFDLHVLSTQPAFVLSQDQTLHKKLCCRMNPSKTANPTTGVIEADPINSLTRKTNNFWHHN